MAAVLGFFILVMTNDLAPAEDIAPSFSLVMVAIKLVPSTDTEKVPSIPVGVPDIAVVPPELRVNPDGNVTITLPSLGIGLTVVKLTVAGPTEAALEYRGMTLVPVNVVPLVSVLAVISVLVSMLMSAPVFVVIE